MVINKPQNILIINQIFLRIILIVNKTLLYSQGSCQQIINTSQPVCLTEDCQILMPRVSEQ